MTKDESKILTDPYTLTDNYSKDNYIRTLKQVAQCQEGGMSHSSEGTCPGAPRLLLSAYSHREAYRQTSHDSYALCYVYIPFF